MCAVWWRMVSAWVPPLPHAQLRKRNAEVEAAVARLNERALAVKTSLMARIDRVATVGNDGSGARVRRHGANRHTFLRTPCAQLQVAAACSGGDGSGSDRGSA